jgi:hypothetical protein
LAKPNYQFERRQRDLAKKQKQEEKRQRKLAARLPADGDPGASAEAQVTQSPDSTNPAAGDK